MRRREGTRPPATLRWRSAKSQYSQRDTPGRWELGRERGEVADSARRQMQCVKPPLFPHICWYRYCQ